MARGNEMLAALMAAPAGGFLAQPPGIEGELGLGIPGVSGIPRGRTWDAVVSARAPALTGGEIVFVALEDGTIVVEQDVPDGALSPLADAIEELVPPPYQAAAIRSEEDVWSAVANSVAIVEISIEEGDEIDLSVVGGVRELTVDGQPASVAVPALDALAEEHEDVSLHAERVDGYLFAVDVFPL